MTPAAASLPTTRPKAKCRPIGPASHSREVDVWFGGLFQRKWFFLVEEAHQFAEELHAVLFHHYRMRSLTQFDQPLVRRIFQLREIAVRQVAGKVCVRFGVEDSGSVAQVAFAQASNTPGGIKSACLSAGTSFNQRALAESLETS